MNKPLKHNAEWAKITLAESLEDIAVYDHPENQEQYRIGTVGQDYDTADYIASPTTEYLTTVELVRFAEGVECAYMNHRFLKVNNDTPFSL